MLSHIFNYLSMQIHLLRNKDIGYVGVSCTQNILISFLLSFSPYAHHVFPAHYLFAKKQWKGLTARIIF